MKAFSIEYANETFKGVAGVTPNGLFNPKTIIMETVVGDRVNDFEETEDFYIWADCICAALNRSRLFDGQVHIAHIC